MTYDQELTAALRSRGYPDPEIADILRELDAHGAGSDADRRREFGEPGHYALQFEPKSARSPGSRITRACIVVAVLWAVGYIVVALVMKTLPSAPPLGDLVPKMFVTIGAPVIAVLGSIIGFVVDRHTPARGAFTGSRRS